MKFEESLARLERLVAEMQSGRLGLDDMIKSFEEGRRLSSECIKELESVRQRIEKVTKTGAVEEFKA